MNDFQYELETKHTWWWVWICLIAGGGLPLLLSFPSFDVKSLLPLKLSFPVDLNGEKRNNELIAGYLYYYWILNIPQSEPGTFDPPFAVFDALADGNELVCVGILLGTFGLILFGGIWADCCDTGVWAWECCDCETKTDRHSIN